MNMNAMPNLFEIRSVLIIGGSKRSKGIALLSPGLSSQGGRRGRKQKRFGTIQSCNARKRISGTTLPD